VSEEPSGPALDVTLREFVSGQKVFGRYILTRVLGRGGMGVVWLARDDKLSRDVALKFLPELIVHDHAVLDDLKQETNRSLELTHKNIVRIHDFIYDEKSACISMEYVDGETLSALRVKKEHKIFESDEIVGWIGQLCEALDYAHNQALVVHRDVKPANLMINKRGQLKVADFGIARSLADSVSILTKEPRGTSGTLVYMSPQQLDGERGSHLDDIYSLGATIYELLTSKPPFYSGNIDRQIHERVPPPMMQRRKDLAIEGRAIPQTWEEIASSCLAKEPARRPQSVTEIGSRLAGSAPKIRRTGKIFSTPSKRTAVIIASVTLCVAAVVGLYVVRHKPQVKRGVAGTEEPKPAPSQSDTQRKAGQEDSVVYVAGQPGVKVNTSPVGATVTLGGLEEQTTPTTISASPGRYSLFVELDGYKPFARQVEIREKQLTDLGTITLKPNNGTIELTTVPAGAKVFRNGDQVGVTPFHQDDVPPGNTTFIFIANGYLPRAKEIVIKPGEPTKSEITLQKPDETYHGTIADMPIVIKFDGDRKSGSITHDGDVIAKFSGSWSGSLLRATINEAITERSNVLRPAEPFIIRVSEDGRVAAYKLTAGEKTLSGALASTTQVQMAKSAPTASQPALIKKTASVYKGKIRELGGDKYIVPLTIMFASDLSSGTMTQTGKRGDFVVEFTGVWEGDALHAVTGEVVSKPNAIRWEPESFTLRFAPDGKSGSYETIAEGHQYTADLTLTDEGGLPSRLVEQPNPPVTPNPSTTPGSESIVQPSSATATAAITVPSTSNQKSAALLPSATLNFAAVTKEKPYENSLGMRFVPVAGSHLLFSIWDTRVSDYETFTKETNRQWARPSFRQTPNDPAVNVSWEDSRAFCAWLTEVEQKAGRLNSKQWYRLPTDAEWSLAAGDTKYPWGNQWPPPRGCGNYSASLHVDDYKFTSPVGSFPPNATGLYDMGGNVWQWCEDWYRKEMNSKAALDHDPSLKKDADGKTLRVVRGGSYYVGAEIDLESSIRVGGGSSNGRNANNGFRCVLSESEQARSINTGKQKLIPVVIERYGVSVLLPPEVFPDAEKLNDPKTTSIKGVSWSGRTTLAFSEAHAHLNKVYADCTTDHQTNYKVLRDDWFAVSGDLGLVDGTYMGFYTKGVKKGDEVITMSLQYEDDDFPFYDDETFKTVVRSFQLN
jgi:serine/threonine protein kinase